jgi:hypothetical protein
MRTKNISKILILSMFVLYLFSTTVFAEIFEGGVPPTRKTTRKTTTSYPSKGGGSGTEDRSGESNTSTRAPGDLGGKNNPYVKKRYGREIYYPAYGNVTSIFNNLTKGEGNTSKIACNYAAIHGNTYLAKFPEDGGKFYYVLYCYPTVTVMRETRLKITETARWNDFFNWDIGFRRLDTKGSYAKFDNKRTSDNKLTYTASKVGEYEITYTPHQQVKEMHQNHTTVQTKEYFPYLGSTDITASKKIPGKKNYKQYGVWRKDYRQTWHFKITEPDIIEIDPEDKKKKGEEEVDPNDLGVTSELVH